MMKLTDSMVRNVQTATPETTLAEAARRMHELGIGALPVCDDNQVVGMVTDRDIVIRAVAEGRDPYRAQVRDIMTRDVVSCLESEDLSAALAKMRDRKIGRLVVLSPARRIKGLLTLGDLARQMGQEHMATLVSEQVANTEFFPRLSVNRKRGLFAGAGALAGAVGIFAGLRLLQARRDRSSEQPAGVIDESVA